MPRGIALVVAFTIISALTPVFGKMAVTELPWMTLAWLRFATAGTLLLCTCKLLGRRPALDRSNWPTLLGIAALCVPLNQFGYLLGLKLANAGHAGVFYALTPVLVFWGALILGQTRFRWDLCIASLLAFCGAALVTFSTNPDRLLRTNSTMLRGDLLLLLAVATWAGFSLASRPFVRKHGAIETLSVVFLLGAVMHTPLALIDVGDLHAARITWKGLVGAAYLTLVTGYVNYMLWYLVISRHDITKVAVVVNVSFVITVLVGWLFQGDQINALFLAGCALTLGGIALVIREKLATMPQPAEAPAPRA